VKYVSLLCISFFVLHIPFFVFGLKTLRKSNEHERLFEPTTWPPAPCYGSRLGSQSLAKDPAWRPGSLAKDTAWGPGPPLRVPQCLRLLKLGEGKERTCPNSRLLKGARESRGNTR
jgi:hypothetical protein